ncbi:hypothetical protein EMPG_16095 [Blastomyces silverae]|uniref:Uncharacterized protein n=1 Tax=Blastomyces silverae TaxID=2060906 RepID=A0A0H1BBI6_9EURO|nr:hypothetical protein EMPG_16095 [Blastomyces silverae]
MERHRSLEPGAKAGFYSIGHHSSPTRLSCAAKRSGSENQGLSKTRRCYETRGIQRIIEIIPNVHRPPYQPWQSFLVSIFAALLRIIGSPRPIPTP